MKKAVLLGCLLFAVFLLNACQTTTDIDTITTVSPELTGERPIRAIPVDVMNDYIVTGGITPQAVTIDQGDLFDNGGFEAGLAGWTGCSAGAIAQSSDAYEGNKALKVNAGNCFYRSVEVSVGQDLILSCYARLLSGSGWTGMGLGFADASWTTIDGGPSTIVTGNTYQRYDVEATAPAGSKYVSMWMYSDNPALVDECTLMLEQDPPDPPGGGGDNLLDNGDFETLNAANKPVNWTKGCGGSWSSVTQNGSKAMRVNSNACVDQSLSATDISSLKGKDYTYSCDVNNTNSYASMTIFLDGVAKSTVIPFTNNAYQRIEVTGTAGQISNGFVSLYASGSMFVDNCKLEVEGIDPPVGGGDNILVNSDFESSLTGTWAVGCGGSWSLPDGRNGKGVRLTNGACMDQSFDVRELAGNDYSFSCYVKNPSGYASLSIFFDGTPVSKVVPVSSDYQLVEITGTAPNASSGFVSVYTSNTINVDDCSLSSAGGQPPVQPGTQQWFDRFGGPIVTENIFEAAKETVKTIELSSNGRYVVSSIMPEGNPDPDGDRVINIRKYSDDGEVAFSKSELLSRPVTLDSRAIISVNLIDATVDSSGNVYVLESAVQEFGVARRGQTDLYIHKFNSNGDKLWEKLIRSKEYSIDPRSPNQSRPRYENIVYSSNAIYIAGKEGSTSVVKFNLAGVEQWASQVDTADFFRFQDLATNSNGDVYITSYRNSGTGNLQLTKLNSAGSQLWQTAITERTNDFTELVADDSNVYILGSNFTTEMFAPNQTTDAFIWKYDNAGNQIWTRQYESSQRERFSKAAIYDGHLYVTGVTGAYNTNLTTFIKKINLQTAVEVWATEIDVEYLNTLTDIQVDATGIYTGGFVSGPNDRIDTNNETNSSDAFVTKYSLP